LGIRDVRPKEGTLEMAGTIYQYEVVSPTQLVGLLARPEGTIKISRVASPLGNQKEFVDRLLDLLAEGDRPGLLKRYGLKSE
jgi:hypothetical protein